jgi:cathepsin L
MQVNGAPLETTYPYLGVSFTGQPYPTTNGICDASTTYVYAKDPSVTKFSTYRNQSAVQMQSLLTLAPVGALIYANTGFMSYSSGIYTGCPSSFSSSYSNINHAVVIIGYDSNGNYIVKNSWGTSWGTNGFGIVSSANDCALSAFVYSYSSTATPRTGLEYHNQVKLTYEHILTKSILALVSLVILISF